MIHLNKFSPKVTTRLKITILATFTYTFKPVALRKGCTNNFKLSSLNLRKLFFQQLKHRHKWTFLYKTHCCTFLYKTHCCTNCLINYGTHNTSSIIFRIVWNLFNKLMKCLYIYPFCNFKKCWKGVEKVFHIFIEIWLLYSF